MSRLLLIVLVFATFQLSAQRLENIKAEAVNGGERVIITYDISSASQGQKFKVAIYSSHNSYAAPLNMVTGDINEVTPGIGKRIEWNAKSEMVDYSGDIIFELRADIITPDLGPLIINTPSTAKRGKTVTISYDNVKPNETISLALVRSGVVVSQVGATSNPVKYEWRVPKDVEKGSDYQVRITSGSRTATSGLFTVKSKSKAAWIILPAAVVVGVVVFIVTQKKDKTPADLPLPPDPE